MASGVPRCNSASAAPAPRQPAQARRIMRAVNPAYNPRNHLVE
jgi:hypothetical protein